MARVPAEQRPLSRDGPLSAEVAGATRNAARRKALPLPNGSACPTGFSACPVARKNSPGDYLFACFDFLSSETHCGGCHDVGAGYFMEHGSPGVDCTTLPGVASSACVDGKCRISKLAVPRETISPVGPNLSPSQTDGPLSRSELLGWAYLRPSLRHLRPPAVLVRSCRSAPYTPSICTIPRSPFSISDCLDESRLWRASPAPPAWELCTLFTYPVTPDDLSLCLRADGESP